MRCPHRRFEKYHKPVKFVSSIQSVIFIVKLKKYRERSKTMHALVRPWRGLIVRCLHRCDRLGGNPHFPSILQNTHTIRYRKVSAQCRRLVALDAQQRGANRVGRVLLLAQVDEHLDVLERIVRQAAALVLKCDDRGWDGANE